MSIKNWKDAKELVLRFVNQPNHGSGGCLHYVLDDGNIENRHFKDGAHWKFSYCSAICDEMFSVLKSMSVTQRKKLSDNFYQIQSEDYEQKYGSARN
jgi:hypothetical protein